MAPKSKIQPGMKFGRLTILERVPPPKKGNQNPRWKSICECGNTSEAYAHNLMSGNTKSCGCLRSGPTSSRAKKRTFNKDGYAFIRVPGHPRSNKHTDRVREHIIVMEEVLGRYLLPGEEVHHKNGVRSDNRPENLELWNRSHPSGARIPDQIEWAVTILERYAPHHLK